MDAIGGILAAFALEGRPVAPNAWGSGHINDTFRVDCDNGNCYILQRINTEAFHDPETLMRNIRLVTEHLRAKGCDEREAIRLIPARDGALYRETETGVWRMYEFVRDTVCFDAADSPALFAECGRSFGHFFNQLADFDASLLVETIPHFHDTPARIAALRAAVEKDPLGRVQTVRKEIDAALSREALSHVFADRLADGTLPLRVTHNDTKINNVLFDRDTRRAVCVIDLDTVMPGVVMNDFGDAIRFGASTAAEDERDLGKVRLDLDLYRAFATGYLGACGAALLPVERELLPVGAKMMTYECGTRFLTDYLLGDVYFHIHCPDHNLARARAQFRLLEDMEAKEAEMRRILQEVQNA